MSHTCSMCGVPCALRALKTVEDETGSYPERRRRFATNHRYSHNDARSWKGTSKAPRQWARHSGMQFNPVEDKRFVHSLGATLSDKEYLYNLRQRLETLSGDRGSWLSHLEYMNTLRLIEQVEQEVEDAQTV